jgi:hypothetical protein
VSASLLFLISCALIRNSAVLKRQKDIQYSVKHTHRKQNNAETMRHQVGLIFFNGMVAKQAGGDKRYQIRIRIVGMFYARRPQQ